MHKVWPVIYASVMTVATAFQPQITAFMTMHPNVALSMGLACAALAHGATPPQNPSGPVVVTQ